jgi:hypothetical protein
MGFNSAFKGLKQIEGQIFLVQGTDRCRAIVKAMCIPSAQETRNCVKNCAIYNQLSKKILCHAVSYLSTFVQYFQQL